MNNKAQQEIVGFVLIVVLVVVGLMVFLIISIRTSPEDVKSVEVDNMLNALMRHTTECAVVYEPDYDDFEDLFKSCHQEDMCTNLGVDACDYLNESLSSVLAAMFDTESDIVEGYQIDFLVKNEGGEKGLLRIVEGNCTGSLSAAQRNIVSKSDSLIIRMRVCSVLF